MKSTPGSNSAVMRGEEAHKKLLLDFIVFRNSFIVMPFKLGKSLV